MGRSAEIHRLLSDLFGTVNITILLVILPRIFHYPPHTTYNTTHTQHTHTHTQSIVCVVNTSTTMSWNITTHRVKHKAPIQPKTGWVGAFSFIRCAAFLPVYTPPLTSSPLLTGERLGGGFSFLSVAALLHS